MYYGSKNNDTNSYELKRFASKLNYKIPGIANKILSTFCKKYKPHKIISFADRCWTNEVDNNLYTKLGFKLVKILRPDYKYFNRKVHVPIRLHKFQFGKNSIAKKFPNIFDNSKTEWEMVQELGYDRIWDCGKIKYELKLQ